VFSAVLSQISILGVKSKIGSWKFNGLQTPKLSKKQLCDRTGELSARCRYTTVRAIGMNFREAQVVEAGVEGLTPAEQFYALAA
jgi:hypothetical protein